VQRTRIIIGSRGSKLALWQSEWVKDQLNILDPGIEIEIEIIHTSGDKNQQDPLSIIGGKGVFTKELEDALLSRRIDVAVHSLKDLPTVLVPELIVAAITQREDPRDALVLPSGYTDLVQHSINELPTGARVGTSSPRRLAQLRHVRPDLEFLDLRGNIDTRLRKLDEGNYDAIILASAGLRRIGLSHRISAAISIDEMLPAVGQGALGIETRMEDLDLVELLLRLEHAATRAACTAERAMLRSLGGGCQLPIAGHATVEATSLRLKGLVASVSGVTVIRDEISGPIESAAELGAKLGLSLLENGAKPILSEVMK
jgi:hydroxymethylbilane synthase